MMKLLLIMMKLMKNLMDDDSDKRKVQAVPAFTITSLLMLIADPASAFTMQ
jgi:hypothetical protein